MKSKIDSNKQGVDINITDVQGHKQELLESFQACQEGKCSCPTREYTKVESIDIENSEDSIQLKIKAKIGKTIDRSEIEKCLQHTAKKIAKK